MQRNKPSMQSLPPYAASVAHHQTCQFSVYQHTQSGTCRHHLRCTTCTSATDCWCLHTVPPSKHWLAHNKHKHVKTCRNMLTQNTGQEHASAPQRARRCPIKIQYRMYVHAGKQRAAQTNKQTNTHCLSSLCMGIKLAFTGVRLHLAEPGARCPMPRQCHAISQTWHQGPASSAPPCPSCRL